MSQDAFRDLYGLLADRLNYEIDARTAPQEIPEVDAGVYRRFFQGMELPGLPASMHVGRVRVSQTVGPIRTQRTEMRQRAGFPLLFDKSMERGVEIGHGQWLTVCEVGIPDPLPDVSAAITQGRVDADAAVGYVAAVLDDRIAQAVLGEDLILMFQGEPVAATDLVENVRNYLPYRISETELAALQALAAGAPVELTEPARWYLRGARVGPGVDGLLFLWIAIESLAGAAHPRVIEAKLREAGWDVAHQQLDVGRIQGLRDRIVHHREEKPLDAAAVRTAYYDVEVMARVLLRTALGVESTWPAPPDVVMFDPPWGHRIGESWQHPPAVEWHPPPLPAIEGQGTEGFSWHPIQPPSPPPAEIKIDGGQPQEQHRLRRWAGMALFFFEEENAIQFRIRRLDDETDGSINPEEIVVASRFLQERDPVAEIRLGMRVHVFVASHLLYRRGVPTSDVPGLLIHGVLGGWTRHRVFVAENEIDEDLFVHTPLAADSDLRIVGEHLGAVAAGSRHSEEIIRSWIEAVDLGSAHARLPTSAYGNSPPPMS